MSTETRIARASGGDPERAAEELLARLREEDRPRALVRTTPAQDLAVALAIADDEQRAELLALADRGQVRSVVDLTCWRSDRPDLDSLESLLAPLAETGDEGAVKALADMEDEIRTLLLKRHCAVHLREDENEDLVLDEGSEVIACPDGRYFVELPRPDEVPDVVRRLLSALLLLPFEVYQPELECLRHDLPSELEETAYRWRCARLADLGFGTREDGMALLAPRDPASVRDAALRARAPILHAEGMAAPSIVRRALAGNDLLDRAAEILARSGDPDLSSRAAALGADLAAAANLFLSGVGADIGDPRSVFGGVRMARDLMALGLSYAAGGDPGLAASILAGQTPAALIQAGMGALVPSRSRARRVLRDGRLGAPGRPGVSLDPPHLIAVAALAREIPGRWPPLDEGRDLSPVPCEPMPDEIEGFSRPEEVSRAERLLEEAERVPDLLFGRLGWDERLEGRAAPASALLLTSLAHASGGDLSAGPISDDLARTFGERAIAVDEESFLLDAVAALARRVGIPDRGSADPSAEADPVRRLVLRLVILGRARLAGGGPEGLLAG